MKSRIFLLLFTLSLALPSWAEGFNALQLVFTSGKQVTVMLDDQPLVTFDDEAVVITTAKRILKCTAGDLQKFTYLNIDMQSIVDVTTDEARIAFTDAGISASHLAPLSEVGVYSVDGRLLAKAQVDASGSASVSFAAQQGTVYVVKTSVTTFKMTKP